MTMFQRNNEKRVWYIILSPYLFGLGIKMHLHPFEFEINLLFMSLGTFNLHLMKKKGAEHAQKSTK